MPLESIQNLNLTPRETDVLTGAIQILIKHLRPVRVILFGSRAKGTSRKGSDFDLAVELALPDITIERRISDEIEGIAGLYKVDVAYLNAVDEEFKNIVLKTGRVIYERGTQSSNS